MKNRFAQRNATENRFAHRKQKKLAKVPVRLFIEIENILCN